MVYWFCNIGCFVVIVMLFCGYFDFVVFFEGIVLDLVFDWIVVKVEFDVISMFFGI